ncbi:PucR family transcriptional regulator [Streptomyces sp. NPDC088732]|uniref:PucR family transcriptional regulator n=1 Tax=Streptomyces sp. NPDC088732 TaxID=3365879 RepID=UPI00382CC9DD
MAADALPVLSDAARALAARCESKAGDLARRITEAGPTGPPAPAELAPEAKDPRIAAAARHGLRWLIRRAVRGDRGDTRLLRERAAQHADDGLPLHLLLRGHLHGTHALWRSLRAAARPGEEDALIELAGFLLAAQEYLVGAVSETYVDERAALAAEERERDRSLVRALLDGSLPADRFPAARLGLADGALVLALRLPPGDGPVRAPLAVRRELRRVQAALDRTYGTDVPAVLDTGGGHAVVPGHAVPHGTDEDLLARLRHACSPEIRVAAVPAADPGAIAGAARTASEILRVARAGGLAAGLHRLDDVLLEYHLAHRDGSGERIAALLDPITGRPDLVETLRTYLGSRQERRSTARQLGLHPNTVDNRLARITELTGLDLATPHGTALALAALLLRDAAAAG